MKGAFSQYRPPHGRFVPALWTNIEEIEDSDDDRPNFQDYERKQQEIILAPRTPPPPKKKALKI